MALIRDRKHFNLGLGMSVVFFVILIVMFMPVFSGQNAFEAADDLFNTISKGSTLYIPQLRDTVSGFPADNVNLNLELTGEKAENAATVLRAAGFETRMGDTLMASGNLKDLLMQALEVSEAGFHNRGDVLQQVYGLEPQAALYAWWTLLKATEESLTDQKKFKAAAMTAEVTQKGVEVAYNYYGINPVSAGDRAGILTFSLVFYVAYTLWWGYAIFFLAEGVGLVMTKGAKKEV